MPRGRPRKGLDLDLLEKLAAIHCTKLEIAATVNCDASILSRKYYAEIIEKGRERGKLSLRRKMWDTAMSGNVTMQIWLSKNYLGFHEPISEKSVQDINVIVDDRTVKQML